jgi:hypothetical protein
LHCWLVVGIVRLWSQKKAIVGNDSTINELGKTGVEGVYGNPKTSPKKAINISGRMLKWDHQTGVLTMMEGPFHTTHGTRKHNEWMVRSPACSKIHPDWHVK